MGGEEARGRPEASGNLLVAAKSRLRGSNERAESMNENKQATHVTACLNRARRPSSNVLREGRHISREYTFCLHYLSL
jgi:hypothetical protein